MQMHDACGTFHYSWPGWELFSGGTFGTLLMSSFCNDRLSSGCLRMASATHWIA